MGSLVYEVTEDLAPVRLLDEWIVANGQTRVPLELRRGSPSLWFSAARAHHHEDLGEVDYEIAMPALFRTPHAHWIYVTEADVDGRYARAHLRLTDSDSGILSVQLPDSPLGRFPGQPPGGSRSPARI